MQIWDDLPFNTRSDLATITFVFVTPTTLRAPSSNDIFCTCDLFNFIRDDGAIILALAKNLHGTPSNEGCSKQVYHEPGSRYRLIQFIGNYKRQMRSQLSHRPGLLGRE